jgi:hypothetical protein
MSLGTIFAVFWNLFCTRNFLTSGLRSGVAKAISSSVGLLVPLVDSWLLPKGGHSATGACGALPPEVVASLVA